MAVDLDGNVVITGQFSGTANFGGATLTGTGSTGDVFVVKYDPDGEVLWAKSSSSEALNGFITASWWGGRKFHRQEMFEAQRQAVCFLSGHEGTPPRSWHGVRDDLAARPYLPRDRSATTCTRRMTRP